MTLKIYKTREDQEEETPIIYEKITKMVGQTDDNELDIKIDGKWIYIENINDNWLYIIEA